MFRVDVNRPPSAPCYDRQANLADLPPNAEIPKSFKHRGSGLASPHSSCMPVEVFPISTHPKRTKELYIYKTLLQHEFIDDQDQLCSGCRMKSNARVPWLVDPCSRLAGKSRT